MVCAPPPFFVKTHTHTLPAPFGKKSFDHLSVDTELLSCVTSGVFTNIAIGHDARHFYQQQSCLEKSLAGGCNLCLELKTQDRYGFFTSIACFILFFNVFHPSSGPALSLG